MPRTSAKKSVKSKLSRKTVRGPIRKALAAASRRKTSASGRSMGTVTQMAQRRKAKRVGRILARRAA